MEQRLNNGGNFVGGPGCGVSFADVSRLHASCAQSDLCVCMCGAHSHVVSSFSPLVYCSCTLSLCFSCSRLPASSMGSTKLASHGLSSPTSWRTGTRFCPCPRWRSTTKMLRAAVARLKSLVALEECSSCPSTLADTPAKMMTAYSTAVCDFVKLTQLSDSNIF